MALDNVYNTKILDYAGNIGLIGRLDAPHGSAKAHSKLCGSTVTVDVRVENGRVSDYAQDVKACALGQASAAILAENVIGATLDELRAGQSGLKAMLKDDGPTPGGRFEALSFLEPVKEYRSRHASTMLPFDAVVKAVEEAVGGEKVA
ncbi:MAG: iron-sulfur cluster assembly scaffold protein [Pseudomonadota bacterium]